MEGTQTRSKKKAWAIVGAVAVVVGVVLVGLWASGILAPRDALRIENFNCLPISIGFATGINWRGDVVNPSTQDRVATIEYLYNGNPVWTVHYDVPAGDRTHFSDSMLVPGYSGGNPSCGVRLA